MVVVYKKTAGRAHDLRFVEKPEQDDIVIAGAHELPDLATLNDQVDQRQARIAEIDAQMNVAERDKLLGRTVREDMLWRWVKDYVRDVLAENPSTLTDASDPRVVTALAALTDPASAHYSSGFERLKQFDDAFVALRAERTKLQQELAPK